MTFCRQHQESLRYSMAVCMKNSKAIRIAPLLTVILLLQPRMSALADVVPPTSIDLREAHIVVPDDLNGPEKKSVALLVDEISARTRLRLPIDNVWPADARIPVIAISRVPALKRLPESIAKKLAADTQHLPPEGFRIRTET